MLAFPAIYTSGHALMYTSLAYLTPQIKSLDAMISHPSATGHVPVEILFLIRRDLIPLVVERLVLDAGRALWDYKVHLQKAFCIDCLMYQREVYGLDIWQWQRIDAACRCTEKSEVPSHLGSPPYFPNEAHWLVDYLSCEVRRLRHFHTEHFADTIEGVVSAALLHHGYDLHVPTAMGYVHEPLECEVHGCARVLVIPREQYGDPTMVDDLMRIDALLSTTLFHAELDCYHLDLMEGFMNSRLFTIEDRHPTSQTTFFPADISDHIHTLFALIAAPLTIPMMAVTTILTVCFFYARPASFRTLYAG